MFQTDKIHESFYELFNQRFRIIANPPKGIKLFTNISIGAHTKPCRVQASFQCVVVLKKSELQNTPEAFLSRFEKFFFSYNSLYFSVCEKKPPNLKIMITSVFKKVRQNDHITKLIFIGGIVCSSIEYFSKFLWLLCYT